MNKIRFDTGIVKSKHEYPHYKLTKKIELEMCGESKQKCKIYPP